MSPARRPPMHESGDRFYTVDVAGQCLLWQVKPDGLLAIVPPAPLVLRYTLGDDDDPDNEDDDD